MNMCTDSAGIPTLAITPENPDNICFPGGRCSTYYYCHVPKNVWNSVKRQ